MLVSTSVYISHILKPENDIEQAIINNNDFIDGAMSGEPRPGHPEGKILYHIREVLDNIDIKLPDDESFTGTRKDLRFIAFIHDTFKYKVNRLIPKRGENHHAMIARRFAEKYTDDTSLLDIIELHDEAYNAWNIGVRKSNWKKAEDRVNKLFDRLGRNLPLFILFYACDNETGDKSQENILWFRDQITKRAHTNVSKFAESIQT